MKEFLRSYKTTAIMLVVLLYIMYETQPASTKSNEAVFIATDYSFAGPDSLPAGWTSFHIENKGNDLHHILLVQLGEGKARADFEAALKADPTMAKLPGWMKFAGGPNAVAPGEAGTATVKLKPGDYLLICVIPDPKGIPHFARGMIKTLTVTSVPKLAPAKPNAARTIELNDFGFAIPKPLTAGDQTIRVVNKGNQAHEIVLLQLPPNTKVEDFGRHFMPNAPDAGGPPPGKPIGGVTGLDKDGNAYFTADLTPGHYGLICFMPDTSPGGRPHFTKGMMADFTIP